MARTGDLKWVSLVRIPGAIRFVGRETIGWFGLAPAPTNPILYDNNKRRYVEKFVPSEIPCFWTFVLFGIVMALTGLTLAFPDQFSFVYLIVNPIGSALTGVTGLAFMLALHRLMTLLLVAYVMVHIYAAFVFKMFTSMITGSREERIT